ncbi:MAG: hypothetical protein AVO35_12400 [Candidatus Aegiribacteria sp. MLS_C]|nr:MAG: hypothetical protein AVO35_12400 [Candidatus Aegiribacteria sp. MLS_C]
MRFVPILCILLFLIPSGLSGQAVHSGCEVDYPPFCFADDSGEAAGFSVELLTETLGAMGRDVVFETGTWTEVKGWLESGSVDALPLVGRTPEREDIFDFTFPYMTLHGAVVVRADCDSILSAEDLSGLVVGVMEGDNAEEYLRGSDLDVEIVTEPTFLGAFEQLSAGSLDAVVVQRIVALRLISEHGFVDLKVLDWPLLDFRQDFCFAVREGDSELLALLNEGLALVMADGTYSHLHASWFAYMEIPAGRRVIVGGDRNFPPYEYLDSLGNPTGMNVEIVRAIAAEVGMDVDVRLGDWSSVINRLENGTIDAISGVFYSPHRDRLYEFTQPHTAVHYVAVVREGIPPSTFEELEGLSLSVERDDIMHDLLEEHGLTEEANFVPNQEMALREVALGASDCALVGRISASYWIERNGWDLEVGSNPIYTGNYCIATARGNMALAAQFSEGLRILVETGAYRRIFEKWMGQPPFDDPVSFAEILRRSLVVLLPLGFLLIWILLWLRLLRRQVRLKTVELRQNQALLKEMEEIADVGGWEFDPGTGAGTWTDQTARIHGVSPDEPVSLDYFLGFYGGDFAGMISSAAREAVESGKPFDLEMELVTPDGSQKWVRVKGKPEVAGGKTVKVRGSIQDVTDIRNAEERIIHLNRVLLAIRDINQLIVRENSPERLIKNASEVLVAHRSYLSSLIILVDPQGNPVAWHQAGMEDVHASVDSLLASGKLPGCAASTDDSGTPVAIEGDDRKEICSGCPLERECADSISMSVGLVNAGICHGYMAVALEESIARNEEELELISEMAGDIAFALNSIADREARKRAEEEKEEIERQLMQSQKMEAVGRLAGGVAHDFNNILQVILGHSHILLENDSLCPEDSKNLIEINDGAQRAAELTKQLLLFSRRQVMEIKPVDFNTLVSRTLNMLRRLIGEDIRLEWLPGNNVGSIRADSGMIEQVLMNLCVNARDAMPKGGLLTIETMNVVIDSEYCASHAWARPGRFVLLTVTDTGQGIEKDIMEHIFEPFFTTKPEGEGTGIGLATVYGIVRQHDGMITAYSEPGKGSMFKLYFPLSEQKAVAVGARIEGRPEGGSETVLLAEDDEMVRQLAVMMLERVGYTVLTASDGEEAIEVFRANPSVDLLLLDVIMPKMSGNEVLQEIRTMDPDVKAVFTSGYTQNAIHTNFILHQGILLLQKPYTSDRLLRMVRQALDPDK